MAISLTILLHRFIIRHAPVCFIILGYARLEVNFLHYSAAKAKHPHPVGR